MTKNHLGCGIMAGRAGVPGWLCGPGACQGGSQDAHSTSPQLRGCPVHTLLPPCSLLVWVQTHEGKCVPPPPPPHKCWHAVRLATAQQLGHRHIPLSPVPTALPSRTQHRRSQALFSKWKLFVSCQSPNTGLNSPNKTSCHLNCCAGLAIRAETLLVPPGPVDCLIADSW